MWWRGQGAQTDLRSGWDFLCKSAKQQHIFVRVPWTGSFKRSVQCSRVPILGPMVQMESVHSSMRWRSPSEDTNMQSRWHSMSPGISWTVVSMPTRSSRTGTAMQWAHMRSVDWMDRLEPVFRFILYSFITEFDYRETMRILKAIF